MVFYLTFFSSKWTQFSGKNTQVKTAFKSFRWFVFLPQIEIQVGYQKTEHTQVGSCHFYASVFMHYIMQVTCIM